MVTPTWRPKKRSWDRYDGRDHCPNCGRWNGNGAACSTVVCPACDTRQCSGIHGECRVCLYGLLSTWGRATCGYGSCNERSVAKAPRVGVVCENHIDRPKINLTGRTITVAGYIAERLVKRDTEWEAVA